MTNWVEWMHQKKALREWLERLYMLIWMGRGKREPYTSWAGKFSKGSYFNNFLDLTCPKSRLWAGGESHVHLPSQIWNVSTVTFNFQTYRTTRGSRGDFWCVTWTFTTYWGVRCPYASTGWRSRSREKAERVAEERANTTHQQTFISAVDGKSLSFIGPYDVLRHQFAQCSWANMSQRSHWDGFQHFSKLPFSRLPQRIFA